MDVVCGRGEKLCRIHPGNIWFRSVIDSHRDEYKRATHRETKTTLVRQIIDIVERRGGRFVKKVKLPAGSIGWIRVDDRAAREKVGYAIRNEAPLMDNAEKAAAAQQKKKKRRISEQHNLVQSKHQQTLYETQQRIFQQFMDKDKKSAGTKHDDDDDDKSDSEDDVDRQPVE